MKSLTSSSLGVCLVVHIALFTLVKKPGWTKNLAGHCLNISIKISDGLLVWMLIHGLEQWSLTRQPSLTSQCGFTLQIQSAKMTAEVKRGVGRCFFNFFYVSSEAMSAKEGQCQLVYHFGPVLNARCHSCSPLDSL